MNLIHGFGKYNFFGGYRVPLGRSGGTRPPPGWPLWPLLSPKAPLKIFLKPLKTFHSNPEKVLRPLVALALAKNLNSVGPWCVFSSIFLPTTCQRVRQQQARLYQRILRNRRNQRTVCGYKFNHLVANLTTLTVSRSASFKGQQ